MAFFTKLFQLTISNTFYTTEYRSNDFLIKPTTGTHAWMEQHHVRWLCQADGAVLLWLTPYYDNPLALFKDKAAGMVLSFVLLLENNQALNFLELELGYPSKIYYLHNKHFFNEHHFLHHESYMGQPDLIKREEMASRMPVQSNVLAFIDIDVDAWFSHLMQGGVMAVKPITYTIQLKSRSVFWRYHFVDTLQRLKGKLAIIPKGKVIDRGKDATPHFTAVEASKEAPHTYCAESKVPILFTDKYNYVFSLYGLSNDAEKKTKTILLENLPYPTAALLKREGIEKYYSDIVVYV